jgi:hypothetical protein
MPQSHKGLGEITFAEVGVPDNEAQALSSAATTSNNPWDNGRRICKMRLSVVMRNAQCVVHAYEVADSVGPLMYFG